jgi:serine/threonine-protein kinase ATR
MVAGFGPTGCEGPFRLACEAALGLMRKQKDVLMSSLRPFVYDPLVDWIPKEGGPDHNKRLKAGDKSKETGEIVNETAVVTLENITSRLKGLVEEKKKTSDNLTSNDIPLSVVGQVQYLIKEATAYENLSQMYHGWAPYM